MPLPKDPPRERVDARPPRIEAQYLQSPLGIDVRAYLDSQKAMPAMYANLGADSGSYHYGTNAVRYGAARDVSDNGVLNTLAHEMTHAEMAAMDKQARDLYAAGDARGAAARKAADGAVDAAPTYLSGLMRANKVLGTSVYTPEERRFLDARDRQFGKTIGGFHKDAGNGQLGDQQRVYGGTNRSELIEGMGGPLKDGRYRTSGIEAPAWGTGNSAYPAQPGDKYYDMQSTNHLDSTMATDHAVYRDLALRAARSRQPK